MLVSSCGETTPSSSGAVCMVECQRDHLQEGLQNLTKIWGDAESVLGAQVKESERENLKNFKEILQLLKCGGVGGKKGG